MISLAAINAMDDAAFVQNLADIAEHSPWVAACVVRPFLSRADMIEKFSAAVLHADEELQLSLLRAHPDLATRAKLTVDSRHEQKGAGLDNLSSEEFEKFTLLNMQYKSRNGFPFIFAVKGATKYQILDSFESRIHNTKQEEFAMALRQVCKIIGFRLESRVSE